MALLRHFVSMATVSLVVLVLQNSLLVVLTRFSRKDIEAAYNYHTSTLVLNQEVMKLVMCLVVYGFDDVRKQYCHTTFSGAGAAAAHQVNEAEVDVPLIRSGSSSSGALRHERSGSPAESVETQPFVDEETAEARVPTPPGVPGPQLVVVGDVGARDVGDEFGAAQAAATAPAAGHTLAHPPRKTPSAAAVSAQLRRSLRATVSATSCAAGGPLTHKSSSTVHVGWSIRKQRFFFLRKRVQLACSLYASMLAASVVKRDTLKLFVPAFLFNIQNFLLFVGLSNLDAVSFQVWSQTKLLSTAIFSVWLLGRKLSPMQWLSLLALTAGVLGAQLGASPTTAGVRSTPSPRQLLLGSAAPGLNGAEELHLDGDSVVPGSALVGVASCIISGLSSSYAGVYFEMVVKTTSPTLSIRNIQLSLFGIPLAFVSMLALDVIPSWYATAQCGQPVHWNIFAEPTSAPLLTPVAAEHCPARPFYYWQRYDRWLTWGIVCIHAFGGLLVAIVVKYADNILKGFATGVAVIVSGMLSAALWGYEPSPAFIGGAVLVIGASIAFHKFELKR
ncbi:UDP-galactose transporter [Novymonas esmeraldas]|uniref:UDP-galactose transporter n=1 Tax=Novymonas esmeraldas TaxID=1808958 RepID=A0AAW0EXW0_9TRYP